MICNYTGLVKWKPWWSVGELIFLTKKTSFLDIECEFAIGECGEVFGKIENCLFEFDKLILVWPRKK